MTITFRNVNIQDFLRLSEHNLAVVNESKPETRTLWGMTADSEEGKKILLAARRLACKREFSMLSDAELIRKASGVEVDPREGLYR